MSNTNHRKLMLRALAKVALPAIEAAPVEERADAFEGIAIACSRVDPEMASVAMHAAKGIRESQCAQLTFRQLLS